MGIGAVTFDDVVRVARGGAPVTIADDALAAIAARRTRIQELADHPTPVYGISTGSARSPVGTSHWIGESNYSAV